MLVLGFGPYGDQDANPSQALVEALDGRRVGGRIVRGEVLPVRYDTLHARVDTLLRTHRPLAVVAFGLRPGERAICLERHAFNRNDFAIADNAGARECGVICAGEPGQRTATLPVDALREALLRAGIPARVSDDAGRFLCNALMYALLSRTAALEPSPPAGFVHLPSLSEQVAAALSGSGGEDGDVRRPDARAPESVPPSMSLELVLRAATLIVERTLTTLA